MITDRRITPTCPHGRTNYNCAECAAHIPDVLAVVRSSPFPELVMESLVLPGVPPSSYIASLVSDLIAYADSDVETEGNGVSRVHSRVQARQAARLIATLLAASPEGGAPTPRLLTTTSPEPTLQDEDDAGPTFYGDLTPLVLLFRDELPAEGHAGDEEGWDTAETAARLIRRLTRSPRAAGEPTWGNAVFVGDLSPLPDVLAEYARCDRCGINLWSPTTGRIQGRCGCGGKMVATSGQWSMSSLATAPVPDEDYDCGSCANTRTMSFLDYASGERREVPCPSCRPAAPPQERAR